MRFYFRITTFFFLTCFIQVALSATTNITTFRFSTQPDKTRLVFEATGPINYNVIELPNNKIKIAIKNGKFSAVLNKKNFAKTPVDTIKINKNEGDLLLNISLKYPVKLRYFLLQNPNRLVLDLHTQEKGSQAILAAEKKPLEKRDINVDNQKKSVMPNPNEKPHVMNFVSSSQLPAQEHNGVTSTGTQRNKSGGNNLSDVTRDSIPKNFQIDRTRVEKEPKVILKPAQAFVKNDETLDEFEQDLIDKLHNVNYPRSNERDVMIVIDPGHGGHDAGAVGPHGTREKDVNLAVAKALQKAIKKTKGFNAMLTRKGDYFISLRRRLGIAHAHKADMFISVHADAYYKKNAHGASVFALSQRGATSEAARWLAEKENESELGQAISNKNPVLRSVLIDLAQTATISASLEIGKTILYALSDIASLHSTKVEQAAFVVLKSPDIPSLLLESGFISYSDEEMKLRTAKYQREIAARLALGIRSYFVRRPPLGTYLAKMKNKFRPKVATLGDSLPGRDV